MVVGMNIPDREGRKDEASATENITESIRREKTLTRVHKRLSKQVEILEREALAPHERVNNASKGKREDTGRPSFVEALRLLKRLNLKTYKQFNIVEPILELYPKPQARKFALSHVIRVPKIYGMWRRLEDIPWEVLPARFVIKSSHGGGGISVFPVGRRGQNYYDFITSRTITADQMIKELRLKHRAEATYFAEELLTRPDGNAHKLPDDIKVFCFYGEIGFIEVRAEDGSRNPDSRPRARFYLPTGAEVRSLPRPLMSMGRDLSPVSDLDYVLEAASKLSRSIMRPFARIDFFSTNRGAVFGEITQNPGHTPLLVTNWDTRIGKHFDNALGRILDELRDVGELDVQFGNQDE